MEGKFQLFQDVLDFELACAERYRRFVSIVLVGNTYPGVQVGTVLADKIRRSDLMAEAGTSAFVLMSETDQNGARIAIDRFSNGNGESDNLSFALVTFPHDSGHSAELLEAAQRRLDKATQKGPGAIVAEG